MELYYCKTSGCLVAFFGYRVPSIQHIQKNIAELKEAYPFLTDGLLETVPFFEQLGGESRKGHLYCNIKMSLEQATATHEKVIVTDNISKFL